MPGMTPPRIEEAPKSFIGVGTRELVIAAAGLALAAAAYFSDMAAPVRIGLAVIAAGCGVGLAFGRDPLSGRKFEEMIAEILMFYGRDRFHQKGIDHRETDPSEARSGKKKEEIAFFHVRPIGLTPSYFLDVFSLAFLAVLVTYLWGGGLESDLFRLDASGMHG